MSDFAKRLTAAFREGVALFPEYALIGKLGPRGQCHENAAEYVRQNGGEVLRGWVVDGEGFYVKHSIVQHDARTLEVTQMGASPLRFVRHDTFLDDWNALGIIVMDHEAMVSVVREQPKQSFMFGLLHLLK